MLHWRTDDVKLRVWLRHGITHRVCVYVCVSVCQSAAALLPPSDAAADGRDLGDR